jgi:hypothetical protein
VEGTASSAGTSTDKAIERWFIARGVPHFIEEYEARTDIWTRAIPILVVAYLAGGLNALDLKDWTWQRNLLVGVLVIVALVATWAITNRLRHRPLLARPTYVGPPELVVFVIGPALPTLVVKQWDDTVEVLATGLFVLGAIYVGTSYGVVPLLRWATKRSMKQLVLLGNLVVRALPLLLLFTTFLFINAEVWQVAGTLDGLPYVFTLLIFFVLGAFFVLSRVPATMRGLASFDDWSDIREHLGGTPAATLDIPESGTPPPADLTLRQRLNIGLVTVFSQALQITLVAVVLTAFFVVFGILAIPESTIAAWTGVDDVTVWITWSLGDRQLVLSEPLVRVAGFLGAFTGMYFTVVLSTDATYREEFAEDVGPQARQALAVRCAYRQSLRARGQLPASPDAT